MMGLVVVSPEPVDVVRYGAGDVVLRPEAGVGLQPGGVEVEVLRLGGIATLREGDVRARWRPRRPADVALDRALEVLSG